MRPMSFHKGTLIVEFPTAYVDAVKGYEARQKDSSWCVKLETKKGVIIGAGSYSQSGPAIHVSGGQVNELPAWWEHGSKMSPEPWDVVKLFGRSYDSVKVGSDEAG